jgi:serine/threonine-protein kinase
MDELTDVAIRPGSPAGSRFGHYRLRRVLGEGGFGHVWEAEDTVMDRVVALKLLRSEYSENEKFRQRLFREARAAGRLNEPHVVPIHHCGEIGGQLYVDMRLIDGTELGSVLAQEGPLSPARAVAVVRQIAAALDAAHAAQMIHRDIKPANIMLGEDDFACLLDFGLANAATDAKLTSTGFTIGTWAYMAPERFSDGEVDRRADIYSLACVLYECLTGSPPYATSDLPALIAAHLTAPIPRPSEHGPQIPVGFDEVIARGMAKNPEDRYPSAGELARAAHYVMTTPEYGRADTVLASTHAATLPTADLATPLIAPAPAARSTETGAPAKRPAWPRLIELSFTGLNGPSDVAVDITGTVYVADFDNNRVLKLPAGSNTQVELPFAGLSDPEGLAVDTAGNVYVADYGNDRVLKLPGGSNIPIELPFTDYLASPEGVDVDAAGDIYVADFYNDRVLTLPAGSNIPIELPFTGLRGPTGVAVDTTGNVYVTDYGNDRVLKLSAGSNIPIELPFTDLDSPNGVAVDTTGNVYVINRYDNRVLKLSAGSNTPVELPFTGLNSPEGVAVDTTGNVYVADYGNDRVLKLSVG